MAAPQLSPARKRFLSENAERFALLQLSPTLNAEATIAAGASRKATGSAGRGGSLAFEGALVPRLLDPAVCSAIASEYLSIATATGRSDVQSVEFREGVGIADVFVVWHLTDDSEVVVAVNVKRCNATTGNTELSALAPFVALATEQKFDVTDPTPSRELSTWRMVTEWVARRRKIIYGRDYYLLIGFTDANHKLTEVRFEGTLAQMGRAGRTPAVKLHANKEALTINLGGHPIADGYDINAALSRRLLPIVDLDALRAQILAVVTRGLDDTATAELAGRLLDISDDELMEQLRTWTRQGPDSTA